MDLWEMNTQSWVELTLFLPVTSTHCLCDIRRFNEHRLDGVVVLLAAGPVDGLRWQLQAHDGL
jgi:hypothetical protein